MIDHYVRTKDRLCVLVVVFLFSGCAYVSQGVIADADRYADTVPKDFFGDSSERIVYLDQNWDRYDSLWFYNTTQGSNLMPYDVFLNLEQPTRQELFRSAENMRRFRFLTQRPHYDSPDGLPVGFVKDRYKDEDYVGFTCAACHTNQINYQGTGIRIDGGGTLADMESLLLELEAALKATLDQDDKFNRLAVALGKEEDSEKNLFRQTVQKIYETQKRYNDSNTPFHGDQVVHYGYGRLDAFGRIYNQILSHLTPGTPNANPANAPVSYPFLWDAPRHDFVQWNGIANNHSDNIVGFLGPLGRNVGEVMGVFATYDLERKGNDLGYRSSADIRNLVRLERSLTYLQSPVWPEEILPKIDRPLAQQGRDVFLEYKCHLCHSHGQDASFDRSDPDRRIVAQFFSLPVIGTDRTMADNALDLGGRSGLFKGKQLLGEMDKKTAKRFGETTSAKTAMTQAITLVIIEPDHDKNFLRRWSERLYDIMAAMFDNPVKEIKERHVNFEKVKIGQSNEDTDALLRVYKARTLNGIWATAPYLHNGSVPNLYELFLPYCLDTERDSGKACRSNRFYVGSREFDPVRVGLISKNPSDFPELYEFDTSLPGNSNQGHEYTSGITGIVKVDQAGNVIRNTEGDYEMEFLSPLNEEKRMALVEYLKTL